MIAVSGNRSGDLDSLVSSYVKSEILTRQYPNEEVRPLNYFDQSRWKIHRDAKLLFDSCGADRSRFLLASQLSDVSRKEELRIYLTDHNHPEKELQTFSSSIVEITDHHKIHAPIPPRVYQRISNTGSCSTLIAEELLELKRDDASRIPEDLFSSLAEMLYFTIRIDTEHLVDRKQYDLDRDGRALKALSPFVAKEDSFLEEIQEAKGDTDGYSLTDFLARDYKFWTTGNRAYGMSTIHAPLLPFYKQLQEESSSLLPFMESQKIDILFLMHFLKVPILKRELTVIPSQNFPETRELIDRLNHSDLYSPLETEKTSDVPIFRYSQHDPHLSRKKIQPYLHGILINLLEG